MLAFQKKRAWNSFGDKGEAALVGQRGALMPMVIIMMTLGVFGVLPLLELVSGTFRFFDTSMKNAEKQYAAEAAIKRVIADITRGADALSPDYQIPTVQMNYVYVAITITSPPAGVLPTPPRMDVVPALYHDPGLADPDLAVVEAGYGYLMRVYNVNTGILQVNWAFQAPGITRIGIWQGKPVDPNTGQPYPPGKISRWPAPQPIVETSFSGLGTANNLTDPITIRSAIAVAPGVYTIMFDNTTGSQNIVTKPFSSSGGSSATWIYAAAYKDYLLTAAVDGVTLNKAYLRQMPGPVEPPAGAWSTSNPAWVENKVFIESWSSP